LTIRAKALTLEYTSAKTFDVAIKQSIDEISQDRWERACTLEAVVRRLAGMPSPGVAEIDFAASQLGLKRAYVYKLLARYRACPKTSTLVPGKRGRPCRTRLLDRAVDAVVQASIHDFYLKRERPRMSDLVRDIAFKCSEKQLKPPTYETVKRRVADLDLRVVVKAREGAKAARERFGPYIGQHPETEVLGEVEIDHTPIDVIVVNEKEGRPIGRPWLTLSIDVVSRMVTGFYVALHAPSALSVALVVAHSVLPKKRWLDEHGIDLPTPWPAAGIPDQIHFDNAKEFHSEVLARGAREYGIAIKYRPPGSPNFGGHIERLIGTFMGSVHILPGTTFSSVAKKGDYDPEKTAAMTMVELERWLALQIGVYHNSIHSTLKTTPLAAWESGISKRKTPHRHPHDESQFFLDFLPGARRLIRRDGIRLFHIRYWDPVLTKLAARSTEPTWIKYDPRDLSRVWIRDSDGNYLAIPYGDVRLPRITLWEHDDALSRLRAEGRAATDEKLIFQMVRQQRELVATATARTTKKQRRRAELNTRALKSSPDAVTMTPPSSAPTRTGNTDYGDLAPLDVEEWS
jgi:putative transposase